MRTTKAPPEDDHSFSARLRRYRIAKNLTIAHAAGQHKVVESTWANWECRNIIPRDFHTARRIFGALERYERTQNKKGS